MRHFLGWDVSVIDRVADFLLPPHIERPPDLERSLIIVPTRQAGRRLREAMALRCSRADSALLSARVETPAAFTRTERNSAGVASPVQVAIAWTSILMEIDAGDFRGLFPAAPPDRTFSWALGCAEMLHDLREALADGGLSIGEVLEKFAHLLDEQERWRDLCRLEKSYLNQLDLAGLEDPCRNKIQASVHPELAGDVDRIVVAAVPDPSTLMVTALAHLAESVDVDILIHAPDKLSECFDAFGRPDMEYWKTAAIDIPFHQDSILLAASPEDQSRKVMSLVARHAARWGPADLAIGVPDRSVVPFLTEALEMKGLGAFDPAGRSPEKHPIFSLVRSLYALIAVGDYRSISAALRHPDMLSFLHDQHGISPSELMRELDDFQNERLPSSLRDFTDALRNENRPMLCRSAELLEAFRTRLNSEGICPALRSILREIYDTRKVRRGTPADDEFIAVAELFDEAIHELDQAVEGGLNVSAATALELMLRCLGRQIYNADRGNEVIDLEGWLELPWNNAPLLIVTGMNDGFVPDGSIGDLFLPDSLRVALGLRSDESRLTRDAYLMRSFIESREGDGRLYFVVGKAAQNGEPLKPSRLLFRCGDSELRERARLLFGEAKKGRDASPFTMSFRLQPDPPAEVPVIRRISVTAFKSYLTCPFRFYLRNVLAMEERDDSKTELDAMDFGNLVHYALQRMGEDQEVEDWHDEKTLAEFLWAEAGQWANSRFGAHPPLQVAMQLDAARQRLAAAARQHVGLLREGWRTIARESRVTTELNGMTISGIIDRVDRHEQSGRIRIIDYKTSDTPVTPMKAHLARAEEGTPDFACVTVDGKSMKWCDLQLPLYCRLLAPVMDLPDELEVGYFNLPKAIGDTGLSLWGDFSATLQSSAEACAAGVISAVQAGRFWPPADRVVYDDFESILLGDPNAAVAWQAGSDS